MKIRLTALLLAAMLLTGCRAIELEDRSYPQAMELDLRDKILWGGFGEFVVSGESLTEVLEEARARMDKYLDLGHIRVIVFGKALLADAKARQEVLDQLGDMPLISRGSMVFAYDYQEESFLMPLAEAGKEPGQYLFDLYQNNPDRERPASLGDLLRQTG